jgi:hypothetical protein
MASSVAGGRDRPRQHVVGPLILLGTGVLLLLNNLGTVPWTIWDTLWPFWPVLFILLGLEALATGRVGWGGVLLTLVLVGLGGLVINAFAAVGTWPARQGPVGAPTSQFRHELGGATRARVLVQYGGGTLTVGSLDDGSLLATGARYGPGSDRIETRYRVRQGVGELQIESGGNPFAGMRGGEPVGLDIRLNRAIPLELRVEGGASDMLLDLSGLQVSDLRVETGASRGTIKMPTTGQTRASIEGGATTLRVEIPPDVAARISVAGGLSDIQVDETRFPRQGDEYRSATYDTAENRLDLTISVGVARVQVQ